MIDLHIHSVYSDGTDSIDKIIKIAKEKKLTAISLTDHDTTYGVKEIQEKANNENIKVIPGLEISSVSNNHVIHILGYNIDIDNSQLQDLLKLVSNYFNKTFIEHFHWLNKNHIIDFELNKVLEYTKFKQSLALSDIMKTMIAHGHPYTLKEWPEFLRKIIKSYPSHFIQDFPLHPSDAVQVIKHAGGIPVFAHPARIGEADINEMKILLPHGLGGVEVYYPYHDEELVARYEKFADQYNLIKTGGTDWHGKELTIWNAEIGDWGVKKGSLSFLP